MLEQDGDALVFFFHVGFFVLLGTREALPKGQLFVSDSSEKQPSRTNSIIYHKYYNQLKILCYHENHLPPQQKGWTMTRTKGNVFKAKKKKIRDNSQRIRDVTMQNGA